MRYGLRIAQDGRLRKYVCSCGELSTLLWSKAWGHALKHGILLDKKEPKVTG